MPSRRTWKSSHACDNRCVLELDEVVRLAYDLPHRADTVRLDQMERLQVEVEAAEAQARTPGRHS